MKLKRNKLLYGVGVNDANYTVVVRETISGTGNNRKRKIVWACPFYAKWSSMLTRCYSKTSYEKRPKYRDSFICNEWLTFSTFKAWMETQDWEGKHLDKDLLIEGNKVYSPETCLFVTPEVNVFMTEVKCTNGKMPLGVGYRPSCNNYVAQISVCGKRTHIGVFDTAEEAHLAWKEAKRSLALKLAEGQTCELTRAALIAKYSA